MRIPLVMAVASQPAPEDHESEEAQQDGDDGGRGGVAHCTGFPFLCLWVVGRLLYLALGLVC